MKNVEIKKVGVVSAFKAVMYLMVVPFAIFALIGIFIALIGLITKEYPMIIIGVMYTIMPIIIVPLYGVFGMLASLVYNLFASKFGGLELTIEDKENTTF